MEYFVPQNNYFQDAMDTGTVGEYFWQQFDIYTTGTVGEYFWQQFDIYTVRPDKIREHKAYKYLKGRFLRLAADQGNLCAALAHNQKARNAVMLAARVLYFPWNNFEMEFQLEPQRYATGLYQFASVTTLDMEGIYLFIGDMRSAVAGVINWPGMGDNAVQACELLTSLCIEGATQDEPVQAGAEAYAAEALMGVYGFPYERIRDLDEAQGKAALRMAQEHEEDEAEKKADSSQAESKKAAAGKPTRKGK